MPLNDQLTRDELIRLEAFAQVTGRHQMRSLSIAGHIEEALIVETFLKAANTLKGL